MRSPQMRTGATMSTDIITRCRTAAATYQRNAEPHIGSTVDLSARDVMSYAGILDEAATEIERLRSAMGPDGQQFMQALVDEASAETQKRKAARAEADRLRRALLLIAHTFTEDSHGGTKMLPASEYQDMARAALSATGASSTDGDKNGG